MRLYIKGPLGKLKVRDVTRAVVLKWLAGLKRQDRRGGPLNDGTKACILATLGSILDFPVEDDLTFDVDGIAAAIELALELDESDRRRRIERMAATVAHRDVYSWTEQELATAAEAGRKHDGPHPRQLGSLVVRVALSWFPHPMAASENLEIAVLQRAVRRVLGLESPLLDEMIGDWGPGYGIGTQCPSASPLVPIPGPLSG